MMATKTRYLSVSYREGKPTAAYLSLGGRRAEPSTRCEERFGYLVVDFAEDGQPVGIEIVHPSRVQPDQINQVLDDLDQPPLHANELKPLIDRRQDVA